MENYLISCAFRIPENPHLMNADSGTSRLNNYFFILIAIPVVVLYRKSDKSHR